MKVLVVAAHPDDEVLGMGGTILRHVTDGDEVFALIMTQAHATEWPAEELAERRQEVVRAHSLLGIRKTFFGDLPSGALNLVATYQLCGKVREAVEAVRPQMVYAPPRGDVHHDHDLTLQATLVACRPLPGSPVRTVLSYEMPVTTRYCLPSPNHYFSPNYYVGIGAHLSRKLQVMEAYRLELRDAPHPRSLAGLELFARERGMAVGIEYAEAFTLIRHCA